MLLGTILRKQPEGTPTGRIKILPSMWGRTRRNTRGNQEKETKRNGNRKETPERDG